MNLFGVGPTEIFVVLIVILVLFGPDKLPELAKKIGGASREIREGLDSINEQMNTALEASMNMEKEQMIKPAAAVPETTDSPTIAPPDASSSDTNAQVPPADTPLAADANPSQS